MNIFKHQHDYKIPRLKDCWKQIHEEIFIKGNMETKIQVRCSCGHTKMSKATAVIKCTIDNKDKLHS